MGNKFPLLVLQGYFVLICGLWCICICILFVIYIYDGFRSVLSYRVIIWSSVGSDIKNPVGHSPTIPTEIWRSEANRPIIQTHNIS